MRRGIIAGALLVGSAFLSGSACAQQPGREPGAGAQAAGGPANPLLQVFDTDRDGTLSAAEIDAAAATLRRRDANNDGKITGDELPRGPAGRGGAGGGPGAAWRAGIRIAPGRSRFRAKETATAPWP